MVGGSRPRWVYPRFCSVPATGDRLTGLSANPRPGLIQIPDLVFGVGGGSARLGIYLP